MATTFWGKFSGDKSRMRDTAEMAQRTKVATFGGGVTAIRDPETNDLHIMGKNEQDVPERLASFHGSAWNAEVSETSGDGEAELVVYHNAGAPIPTAMLGDRRPAKDAAAPAVKVSNLVRAPAKSPTRDMARHKDTSPVLAMQARNVALRSTWVREAHR
jgi:hypothetical protein